MHEIGRWMKRRQRRELALDLGRLGEGDRLALRAWCDLLQAYPRRWWWIEDLDVAWVIGM